jgi:hypothetical protein
MLPDGAAHRAELERVIDERGRIIDKIEQSIRSVRA